ncbi:MAG: SusF/SusE family outer membrane protein [Bacteroidales bacterium]|nr:SusF/SusE family outer membrane protein [Bacteroidales bacterium]MCF8456402.1 SusF/SusE family outer membrane protein [Bacteroidales bacterium]
MKKNILKLSWILMAALLVFSACKKDDDDDPVVTVEDGMYVKGAGTALTGFDIKGLLKTANNEVTQEPRAELKEIYIAVKGGADGFNIVTVAGTEQVTYGPGPDFAEVDAASLDVEEPKAGLWRGSIIETTTPFTVAEDGLYHFMYDTELMIGAIAKVEWGIIGGATPGGWSDNTPLTSSGFDLNAMSFSIPSVTILENEWKFRYSNGWKIILDADYDLGGGTTGIKVNTNLGGAIDALVAGGGNIANAVYANYTVTLNWTLGAAYTATSVWESDAEPLPEYPENLYMIGATVGGWDWATIDLPMVAVHSHPELFWKIVWMEAGVADEGIKFAPAKEWVGDFGKTGDATNGVWAKGAENVPGPAVSGYYMVVVDLENETVEVNVPTVYLIGDCIGSWDALNPDGLFTVDNVNKVVTITKDLVAGNVRMYAAATTLAADWWQAEFNIFSDVIEFRATGGDQDPVTLAAGNYTINLNFINHAGTITTN